MKSTLTLFGSALLGTLVAPSAIGATMLVNPGVAPAIDGDDIASLQGTVDVGGNLGHVWSNRARQGQTFTTGNNPGGYSMDSFTLRVRVDQASTTSSLWEVRVGTVGAGPSLTPIATETAAGVTIPNSTAGNNFPAYVTWALDAAVVLAPNTVYGFDVYPNGGGFISLNDTSNPYAGGGGLTLPSPGGSFTNLAAGDRHFHVNLTAVPEASSFLLTLTAAGMALGVRRRPLR